LGKIVDPRKRYYLASTQIKSKHPLRRNKSDKAFVFQLSKFLFKLNQLVQGIKYGFLKKEPISENQLTHELDNTVMRKHGDTSRKTSRIS
jgi:hypothetical protein